MLPSSAASETKDERCRATSAAGAPNRLEMSQQEETRCLKLLAHTGQIKRRAGRWHVNAPLRSGGCALVQPRHLAERDVQRVRDLRRRYFRVLRDIIAASRPGEQVLLANVQLVRLG